MERSGELRPSGPEQGPENTSASSEKSKTTERIAQILSRRSAEQPERRAQGFERPKIELAGRLGQAMEREVAPPWQAPKAETPKAEHVEQPQPESQAEITQNREVASQVVEAAQEAHADAPEPTTPLEAKVNQNDHELLQEMSDQLATAETPKRAEQILDEATETVARQVAPDVEAMNFPNPEQQDVVIPLSEEQPQAAAEAPMNPFGEGWQDYDLHNPDHTQDAPDAANYVPPVAGAGAGGSALPPRNNYAPGYNPNFQPGPNVGPNMGAGFNPNIGPALGAAVPAAANLANMPRRAIARIEGFWQGVAAGAFAGWFLTRRHERNQAKQALGQQAEQFKDKAAQYEAQVAESQERVAMLTVQQERMAQQAAQATAEHPTMAVPIAEVAAAHAMSHEQPAVQTSAEDAPQQVHVEAPKRVEMMADQEVLEASKYVEIGQGKTLNQLKQEDNLSVDDIRELLRIAESGNMNEVAHRARFIQEVQRIRMRHELDPALARSQTQEQDKAPEPAAQPSGQSATAQPVYPDYSQAGIYAANPTQVANTMQPSVPPALSSQTGLQKPHTTNVLIVANIVAFVVLGVSLLVLLAILVMR